MGLLVTNSCFRKMSKTGRKTELQVGAGQELSQSEDGRRHIISQHPADDIIVGPLKRTLIKTE